MKKLVVVVGPSCSGKTTLTKALEATGRYRALTSFTTRAPRVGEVDGRDYYFLTPEKYQELEEEGMVIERTKFVGCYYGLLRSELEKAFDEGKIPCVVVEPNGLRQLTEQDGFEVIAVSVTADYELLLTRVLQRNLDEMQKSGNFKVDPKFVKRLANMVNELDWPDHDPYDIWFQNIDQTSGASTKQCVSHIDTLVGEPALRAA